FHFTIVADEVEAFERAAADGEQPELAGKRVLIVDDNASNRLLLKLHSQRHSPNAGLCRPPQHSKLRPRRRSSNRESRPAGHSTATCSISFAKISEGRRHCWK